MTTESALPPIVILAGGLGTRLRSVVAEVPKILAPIEGTPFLGHLLRQLERQGAREVILSTGYLGEQVDAFVNSGAWDLRVRCVREQEPLGTGGALRYVADHAGLDEPFLVLNGDTFFSGDLGRLTVAHREHDATATLALVHVEDAARYGTVRTTPDGAIQAFVEKDASSGPAWINAGAYVLEPTLLTDVEAGRNVSLERDVFPRWVGQGLFGCRFPDAAFLDIGTPADYHRAAAVLRQL